MPTFNDNNAQGWRSWQPENLLGDIAEPPLPTLDNSQSDAQLKAELARLRKQAEQQGFAQGQQQGQEEGRKQGYEVGLKEGRDAGFAQGVEQARVEQQALLRQAGEWVSNLKLSLENLDSLIPGRLVQLSLTAVQQLYGSIRVADNHALVTQIRTLMKQDPLLNGCTSARKSFRRLNRRWARRSRRWAGRFIVTRSWQPAVVGLFHRMLKWMPAWKHAGRHSVSWRERNSRNEPAVKNMVINA